ncbi:MAG: hypothetical protein KatS3mg057_1812 [Herpetosiphonaceae bacterium]|nr:MAG: hypothetical protein KatS3mg057_1812 [Herpetosiphonaceae bacterium]
MDSESTAADVYTSALCASTLATLSDQYDLDADRAISWLQTQVGPDGLLPGFRLHSTWIALPAFTKMLGHKSKTTRRMIVGLAEKLSPEWEASMIAWMLNSLIDAGYRRTTQLVERSLELLGTMQRPDGSWGSEDEGGDVQATLMAIRAARRLGIR